MSINPSTTNVMKFNYLKKILLVMRLTIFLIVLTILEAGAKTALSQVNLNARHSSLSSVLSSIKQQTGYVFVTGDLDLDQTRVDVKINNASIENALDACLSGTKLEYKIVDKTVFIKQKEETVIDKIKDALHLDKIDVHGRVAGEDGQPLAGATVFVKGTSNSTITDVNGYFILKSVVQDATISISFVGYDKNEVKAQSELGAIKMVQAHSKLDEVKVIAYGQTSERLSVGNSATITSKDIEKQPVSNPILALEGQVPGLFIVQSSGIPGSSVSVQVQGQNSIHNGNDPFYVVDGVPFSAGFRSDGYQTIGSNSPLNLINPSDIESISVLKDADATAIYGSRAANGAIIITTKKGKAGTAIVNIKLQDGWGHITREAPLQDISQYLQMRQEALKNDGLTVATTDVDINGILDTTRNVNWQKELIGGTAVCYGDVDHPVPGQIDHRVS
jgi:TonB-dependent SusC/RagA subfamily outer membrane receptor